MTVELTTVSSRLRRALAEVVVSADLTSAVVGGREIEADNARELRRVLSEALYEALHTGKETDRDATTPLRLRDAEFEATLTEVIPHRETTTRVVVRAPRSPAPEDATSVLVERDGVRVWLPKAQILDEGPVAPGDVITALVPATRPALSPGYLLVESSRSRPADSELLRVYVHLTGPDLAASVWARVLGLLEADEVPYRAKILSTRLYYPRRDAMVVYLPEGSWQHAAGIADAVGHLPGVGADTSRFAARLGPGVATAWEPRDSRTALRGLSFGQHRATVFAHAVLDSAGGEQSLDEAIAARCAEAGIDPADPSRNAT